MTPEELERAYRGGAHKLTVADIRNIVMAMRADLMRLRDCIEAHGADDEETDGRFASLHSALTLLGQPENTAELHAVFQDGAKD